MLFILNGGNNDKHKTNWYLNFVTFLGVNIGESLFRLSVQSRDVLAEKAILSEFGDQENSNIPERC